MQERRGAGGCPEALASIAEDGVPGDETMGGGTLAFAVGLRIRLTRDLEKGRDFVNGAVGTIESVPR